MGVSPMLSSQAVDGAVTIICLLRRKNPAGASSSNP